MDQIHFTIKGDIIDVNAFDDREFSFYQECLSAYKQNMAISDFLKLMQDPKNPMMNGSKMITKEIYKKPLFKAVQDLEFRLRVKEGILAPANEENAKIEPDQPDEFVSAAQAARDKSISSTAMIKAVKEGRVAGHQEGSRWRISARSLAQYSPDPARQHIQ